LVFWITVASAAENQFVEARGSSSSENEIEIYEAVNHCQFTFVDQWKLRFGFKVKLPKRDRHLPAKKESHRPCQQPQREHETANKFQPRTESHEGIQIRRPGYRPPKQLLRPMLQEQ
jgi:hypothetical protein